MPCVCFLQGHTGVEDALEAGIRFGDKGTNTSRTMILEELAGGMSMVPEGSDRADYARAIIDDNCLGKATHATRKLTNQRLGELYGLSEGVALFRVLRRLWDIDPQDRTLLALLCSQARDPLLAATADSVLSLPAGAAFYKGAMCRGIRAAVGDRLNDPFLTRW